MKPTILILALLLLVVLTINLIAKYYVKRVFNNYDNHYDDSQDLSFYPPIEQDEDIKEESTITTIVNEEKPFLESKIVLSVENDSSTSNPRKRKDYNDKQNLNSKYNRNTYRSTNGRYRSLKEMA